ncbi:hypothetical protein I4641_00370 [Waterburya agarophytonicola K14]|uniref:Calcium-binding protein n=1 Tax=Waterburya agarophytonicola KI4 TaxID=2874699 RepID=A0A964BLU0_9CYAN|nr:calcium-binding protein [Waterburya agarophytonicola]MCC0175434.1 hypothetical protein [Waterburya agarophytonicola KI4]
MSSVIDSINVSEFDGDGLRMIGTDGFNAFNGSNLGDLIDARGAGDLIDAGKGDDLIDAGMGDDLIDAGMGDDSVLGGGGKDLIFGEKGADIIVSGEGNDVIFGGNGADLIFSGDGDDTVFGGKGNDTINGGEGNDVLFGDAGMDVFEFAIEDLDARFINLVGDFEVGEDKIVITGMSDSNDVTFDANNGFIMLDGDAVISLKDVSNSTEMNMEFNESGDFEIM